MTRIKWEETPSTRLDKGSEYDPLSKNENTHNIPKRLEKMKDNEALYLFYEDTPLKQTLCLPVPLMALS